MTVKYLPLVIVLSVLWLSACAPSPRDCSRADVFCAGLVTDFGSTDEGINREAWLGLQDAKDAHLLDRIDAIETIDARDRAKNISTLAEDGYDVIITVGPAIADETAAAAQKYPRLLFIGVEQPQDRAIPNLTGLVFQEDQSGFLSGALAALTTHTNRVAGLCEAQFIDAMRRYCDGFQAGARYVNPSVNVTVSYREGSQDDLFNDPAWAHKTALGVVHDGADVVFAAGGETADAVLETASQQNAGVIGSETDTYLRLADIRPWLMTSAINDIRSSIRELVGLTRTGKVPPGNFFGRIGLAPFHEWERQIPQSSKDRLNLIQTGLQDGSIRTGIPWSFGNSSNQNP